MFGVFTNPHFAIFFLSVFFSLCFCASSCSFVHSVGVADYGLTKKGVAVCLLGMAVIDGPATCGRCGLLGDVFLWKYYGSSMLGRSDSDAR